MSGIQNKLTYAGIVPVTGLEAAAGMSRGEIISVISDSGHRGRGGAAFPTGIKWNLATAAKDEVKYIICNADEGEPGTFKDREILKKHADLVFEGMTIAGKAVGAVRGILYLRAEYNRFKSDLEKELVRRREAGLVGKNILGCEGFDFDIVIHSGAGAYICGEETALIESIEGARGYPRNRPPFPIDVGFKGHPTVVNNVESMANVACIMAKGADWFKSIGTPKSPGFKILSISGDVEKPGVYEMPFGVSISDMLAACGGSYAKAVQVGGASGTCVPARDFDRKIAFEDVATGGSIMVFGAKRNMLDVAENFLEFFVEESCGQCTPCREGNVKLLEGIKAMKDGSCTKERFDDLLSLCQTMKDASKCGLGQSSPNIFIQVVEHFGDEIRKLAA